VALRSPAFSCVSARLYALLMLPHAVAASSRTLFVAVKVVKGLEGRQERIGTEKMVCMLHGVAWHGIAWMCESLRHYYSHAVRLAALLLQRGRIMRPKRRKTLGTYLTVLPREVKP
jgi:hypothetical protein